MKRKYKNILCFDIDGVICFTNGNNYIKSRPNKKSIKLINDLFDDNYYIKVFTSRFMGRSNQNISLAKKKGLSLTKNQLKKWGLKYHKLIMGKPSYDFFIDDKNLSFKKNWHGLLKKKLK
tara:strand:- start:155 stop:514 length:360 start_codon:yes stop_codon:yes gene_type:complete